MISADEVAGLAAGVENALTAGDGAGGQALLGPLEERLASLLSAIESAIT